jgi:hypothetical protein
VDLPTGLLSLENGTSVVVMVGLKGSGLIHDSETGDESCLSGRFGPAVTILGAGEEVRMAKRITSAILLALTGLFAFSLLQLLSDLSGTGPSARVAQVLQPPIHPTVIIALDGIIWYSSVVLGAQAGVLAGVIFGLISRTATTRLTVVFATLLWSLPIVFIYSATPLPAFVAALIFCFTLAGGLAFTGKLLPHGDAAKTVQSGECSQ